MKRTYKSAAKQALVMTMAVLYGALAMYVPTGWPFALVVTYGFLLGTFWYDLTKWSLKEDETPDQPGHNQ